MGLGLAALVFSVPSSSLADDPSAIGRTGRPNDYLVCPVGQCDNADAAAPVFDLTPEELFARWVEVLEGAPRTAIVARDEGALTLQATQHSRIFRFVDTIWVKIVAIAGQASFKAYSRSETGYWDMGVNKARLERWIGRLGDASTAPIGDRAKAH